MLEYVGFKDLRRGLVTRILRRTNHNLFKGALLHINTLVRGGIRLRNCKRAACIVYQGWMKICSYATILHCCFRFFFSLSSFVVINFVYIIFPKLHLLNDEASKKCVMTLQDFKHGFFWGFMIA